MSEVNENDDKKHGTGILLQAPERKLSFVPSNRNSSSSCFLPDTFEEGKTEEEALWAGVITQAIMDAKSNSKKKEAIRWKAEAMAWLFQENDGFNEVCINAGFNPKWVREQAVEARKCDYVWRKPPKRKKETLLKKLMELG